MAIGCGLLSILMFGRSVYHAWARRGAPRSMLGHGLAAMALWAVVVLALILADRLQTA